MELRVRARSRWARVAGRSADGVLQLAETTASRQATGAGEQEGAGVAGPAPDADKGDDVGLRGLCRV
jgi:hypothetical protein